MKTSLRLCIEPGRSTPEQWIVSGSYFIRAKLNCWCFCAMAHEKTEKSWEMLAWTIHFSGGSVESEFFPSTWVIGIPWNSYVPWISGVSMVSVEGQGAKSPFLPGALQIKGNWLGCLERERPENQGSSEVFVGVFHDFLFSVCLKKPWVSISFNTKF